MKTPIALSIVSCLSFAFLLAEEQPKHDIVIYGGTSAAVIAAVQAKKMGCTPSYPGRCAVTGRWG